MKKLIIKLLVLSVTLVIGSVFDLFPESEHLELLIFPFIRVFIRKIPQWWNHYMDNPFPISLW